MHHSMRMFRSRELPVELREFRGNGLTSTHWLTDYRDSAMFTYSVYLLTIASDSRFPELDGMARPLSGASPDIEVMLRKRRALSVDGSKLTLRTTLPGGRPWLTCAEFTEGYLLRFTDYADFVVSRGGTRIECSSSAPGVSASAVRHLVLDQVFPLVLNLRGRESIHATAILTDRGVCAFTGPAGAGKSTLAASFAMAGYLTVADDCLGLVDAGEICAIPGYPGLRLWSDAARALGMNASGGAGEDYSVGKNRVLPRLHRSFPLEPQPLARIFKVERPRADEPALAAPVIEPLSPTERFIQLISATFPLDVSDREMLARNFRFVEKLAARVPFKRLRIPNDHAALPAVREMILADLESR